MKKVIFASNNFGKYEELKDNFSKYGIELVFAGNLDLTETADTLITNAISKAMQAARETHLPALGDDSGVFIEALDFMPGVHSRRWIGDETDDSARNQEVLKLLKDEEIRTAYLISRFALVDENGNLLAKDVVKNKFNIGTEEKGNNGFGYDKILIPSTEMQNRYMQKYTEGCFGIDDVKFVEAVNFIKAIDGKSIAELTQDEKNKICDRGRIAEKISKALE